MASSQSPIKLGEPSANHSHGIIQGSKYDHRQSLERRVLNHLNSLVIVPVKSFFKDVFPNLDLEEEEVEWIEQRRTALSYIRNVLEGSQATKNSTKEDNAKDENAKEEGKISTTMKGAAKKNVAKEAIGKDGVSKDASNEKDDEAKAKEQQNQKTEKAKQHKAREVELSIALVKGINECCPPESNGKQLRYFDTHVLQGEAAEPYPDVLKREAPDGIVTWKWAAKSKNTGASNGRSPYRNYPTHIPPSDDSSDSGDDANDGDYIPGQESVLAQKAPQTGEPNEFSTVEKSLLTPVSKNPGILFEHKISCVSDIEWERTEDRKLSEEQAKLFKQMDGYNMSQWAYCEPYRFLIGITVTGELMRFWVSGPSGIRASEAFEYMEDATPLAMLLYLYQKSNFGYDVGPTEMFQPISRNSIDKVTKICDRIAEAYEKATGEADWKARWDSRVSERRDGAAWLFNVERHSKDWRDRPVPLAKKAPKEIVVLSVPIAHSTSMISRGTRCYLVFDSALVEKKDIWGSAEAVEIMGHVHTMKTSWISPSRDPEYGFYQKVAERTAGNKKPTPKHLATMLAGGCIRSSKQKYSMSPNSAKASSTTPSVGPRRINWILMKEVGKPLGRFRNTKNFLMAIRDIVETLRTLHGLEILHRDISSGNVLINISNEEGLLIDLDLAKDLKATDPTAGPCRTGTDKFISLAYNDNKFPFHALWHDLESVFWTALYFSIQNKGDVHCGIGDVKPLTTTTDRAKCLEKIFPTGRADFLRVGNFRAGADKAWTHFITTLQDDYYNMYHLLDLLSKHIWALEELLPALMEAASAIGDGPDGAKQSDLAPTIDQLQKQRISPLYQQPDHARMKQLLNDLLALGSPLEVISATQSEQDGYYDRLPDSLQTDIDVAVDRIADIEHAAKKIKFPDCDRLVSILNYAVAKYALSQAPAVTNDSVVKTSFQQQFRNRSGEWTLSTSVSGSSKRPRTSSCDDSGEFDDDADEGNNRRKLRKGRDGTRL
ncbi:hypothetical protein FRC17_002403 [Serendipita sp. 399]|nr:hypothetical protein FRC17_002403 [Serendipita sp. 399]